MTDGNPDVCSYDLKVSHQTAAPSPMRPLSCGLWKDWRSAPASSTSSTKNMPGGATCAGSRPPRPSPTPIPSPAATRARRSASASEPKKDCTDENLSQDRRRPEIGRAHAELQSLMRISYAVFCLKTNKQTNTHHIQQI